MARPIASTIPALLRGPLDALDGRLTRLGRFGSTAVITALTVVAVVSLHFLVRVLEGLPTQTIAIVNLSVEIAIVTAPIIFYARDVIEKLRASRASMDEMSRRLTDSVEQAEAANRAKSAFLANMSHELRTPLNAIMGFSEVMKEQHLGPLDNQRYLGYAGDIHASGKYLLGIINDILDLSKVESGKLVLKQELVDAAALTADCQHLIKGIANEHGVKLMAPTVPQGLKVLADVRLMKQMLINLMTNACKYTPAGGEVRLAWREDAEGIWASVVDTGIGMSQVDIDIAMQPFGQVDNPFVRSREGTGLGLPLVKELIATHGGRLDILSRPGAGSTISLILPRPEAVAA